MAKITKVKINESDQIGSGVSDIDAGSGSVHDAARSEDTSGNRGLAEADGRNIEGDLSAPGSASDGKDSDCDIDSNKPADAVPAGETGSEHSSVSGGISGSDEPTPHQGSANDAIDGSSGEDISADLKAVLDLAGCETAEHLVAMARVGINSGLPPFPNFARDIDPAEIAQFFARDVFPAIHMAADIAGAFIADREPLVASPLSNDAMNDLVAFVRKIGRRATPDVLAQQLVITKHRDKAELSNPEAIGLKNFISVLLDLDDFVAAEQACRDVERMRPEEPKPVPIDETTMETVDGPLETWR